jgi:hypothetical protein
MQGECRGQNSPLISISYNPEVAAYWRNQWQTFDRCRSVPSKRRDLGRERGGRRGRCTHLAARAVHRVADRADVGFDRASDPRGMHGEHGGNAVRPSALTVHLELTGQSRRALLPGPAAGSLRLFRIDNSTRPAGGCSCTSTYMPAEIGIANHFLASARTGRAGRRAGHFVLKTISPQHRQPDPGLP